MQVLSLCFDACVNDMIVVQSTNVLEMLLFEIEFKVEFVAEEHYFALQEGYFGLCVCRWTQGRRKWKRFIGWNKRSENR